MKSKRLSAMLQSLSSADLGTFKATTSDLSHVKPLSVLADGTNGASVVLGRVVAVVTLAVTIPPV